MPQIKGFDLVDWVIVPSTNFSKTLSRAGWAIMSVRTGSGDCQSRHGFFAKNHLLMFKDLTTEMLEAIYDDEERQNRELSELTDEQVEDYAEYIPNKGWSMIGFMSHLSEYLKTDVGFYSNVWGEASDIEIAYKPIFKIIHPETRIHEIAKEMSTWIRKQPKPQGKW